MKTSQYFLISLILVTLLAACASAPNPTNTPPTQPAAEQPPAGNTAVPEPAAPAAPVQLPPYSPDLLTDFTDLVSAAGNCATCHSNIEDDQGTDVSADHYWRAGIMANAARDPYWLATVSSEVQLQPELKDVIEAKCAACHMPLATFDAAVNQQAVAIFDSGFANPGHPLYGLAQDGVSCTVCHQIEPDNFGQPESFSGHYIINPDKPFGERPSYGPFPVRPGQVKTMSTISGHTPIESAHIRASEMCATCHTLYTPYLDAEGQIVGEFPEQTIYQEWLGSAYTETRSCVDCHMTTAPGAAPLSIMGGPTYMPYALHDLAGGNLFMIRMLAENAETLRVTAEPEHFETAIARTLAMLQTQTGAVEFASALVDTQGQLRAEVQVTSLAGHKLPAGYPSRRVWLHLTVTNAAGQVLFESGAYQPDGLIVDNDNDQDAANYEPHYQLIDSAEQVQIYEAILGNTDDEVTTTLLRAAQYLKDNRLLPLGLDSSSITPDIAPSGLVTTDPDFIGGSDVVQYLVDVSAADGPLTITVELLYQAVGYRWANNLRPYGTDLTEQFIGYYDAIDNLPVVISSATLTIEK